MLFASEYDNEVLERELEPDEPELLDPELELPELELELPELELPELELPELDDDPELLDPELELPELEPELTLSEPEVVATLDPLPNVELLPSPLPVSSFAFILDKSENIGLSLLVIP